MQMIHMRNKDDSDLVIFCENATDERKTQDYKDYRSDGFKDVGTFDLTLAQGEQDLPDSVEGI